MNLLTQRTENVKLIQLPDASLIYHPDWIDLTEADLLLEHLQHSLAWQQPEIRMFGKHCKIPRLQAWYGDVEYCYSGLLLTKQPWEARLGLLKQRLNAEFSAGFNSVLVNWYRSGDDSMGWHSDDEPELGTNPTIASVTLGAQRRFQLRHRCGLYKFELTLGHGSLLLMQDTTQHFWQHCLPKQRGISGSRINLTFRAIR